MDRAKGEAAAEEFTFDRGATVEVSFEEEGFRGSWYTAKVVRPVSKRTNKILLQFDTLTTTDRPRSKPLQEHVDIILVRPVPPRETHRSYQLSDEVDAFHNDGWWEGIVTRVMPPPPPPSPQTTTYSVFFRCSREQLDFPETQLRLHREWVHGTWLPPLDPQPSEQVTNPPPPHRLSIQQYYHYGPAALFLFMLLAYLFFSVFITLLLLHH